MFIATTSCEQFWDLSQPMVFLGEHTRRFSRRVVWAGRAGDRVWPGPWTDSRKITAAYGEIGAIIERWLPPLARELNTLHGVGHGVRFWRILLGYWLEAYLGAIYDRHLRVSEVLAAYPEATTLLLEEASYYLPVTVLDFVQALKSDEYNLQIYSSILRKLGRSHPVKSLDVRPPDFIAPGRAHWTTRLGAAAKGGMAALHHGRVVQPRVVVRSISAGFGFEVRLALLSGGGIWPAPAPEMGPALPVRPHPRRASIGKSLWPQTRLEEVAASLLGGMIPASFVEGFAETGAWVRKRFPGLPRCIVSANGWYFDESFRHWAALGAEEGTRLCGMQHGGNYGSVLVHGGERYERSLSERYFTWGWKDQEPDRRLRPAPALKLYNKSTGCRRRKNQTGILFVATSAGRYPWTLMAPEPNFSGYLEWQERFVRRLDPEVREDLIVRLHAEDLGWDLAERWRQWCPGIRLQDWRVPFSEALAGCKIYVCDHLSTTFVEALAANAPTLLFWQQTETYLRPEAVKSYRKLQDVGILHASPEDAATTLGTIMPDVSAWWNDSSRQAARRDFCGIYARSTGHFVKDWQRLLETEALPDPGPSWTDQSEKEGTR